MGGVPQKLLNNTRKSRIVSAFEGAIAESFLPAGGENSTASRFGPTWLSVWSELRRISENFRQGSEVGGAVNMGAGVGHKQRKSRPGSDCGRDIDDVPSRLKSSIADMVLYFTRFDVFSHAFTHLRQSRQRQAKTLIGPIWGSCAASAPFGDDGKLDFRAESSSFNLAQHSSLRCSNVSSRLDDRDRVPLIRQRLQFAHCVQAPSFRALNR